MHAHELIELFPCRDITQKPILLTETEGAQDEALRCPKPMHTTVYLFKELMLNPQIHGVNAAGPSAFNPVERQMDALSHDLTGVILQHDQFGYYFDGNGVKLEKVRLRHRQLFGQKR